MKKKNMLNIWPVLEKKKKSVFIYMPTVHNNAQFIINITDNKSSFLICPIYCIFSQ